MVNPVVFVAKPLSGQMSHRIQSGNLEEPNGEKISTVTVKLKTLPVDGLDAAPEGLSGLALRAAVPLGPEY
jgi:hypothetical protein